MGGFSNLGSVYVEVGADLSSLAKELQGAVAEAGQAGQQIGQSLEQGIAQGAQPASAGLHEVGEAAHEAESSFSSLGESAGELAGLFGIGLGIEAVVEGLKELAESSVEAYGEIQLATVAMTALTGSTEVATEVIEKMKALAMSSIFPDTALINAAQKMAAIGVAAEAIPPLMKAVTDAAVGTGNGLDSVSSALDRIYLSGAVSSRTLSQLGISISDLGTTMGMAADQVKDAFTAMGPQSEAALEILRATIERKMAAAGDAVKGTLPNAINQVKVQWNDLLETIGGSAAGGLTNLLTEINQLIASFRVLGEALSSIGGVGGILSTMFPQIDAVTAVWTKFKDVNIGIAAALDVAKGKYPDFATAVAALDKVVQGATASTQAGTQATLDKAKADQESKDKTDAAAAAAREAYAAHENLKNIKELLTTATSLANEAEKTLAEDMRALSIPAIKELGQAEADVAITRAALVTADGIAKSSLEALNAERQKAVPNAQVLKQLEDDLKTATTNTALARVALKDAESALDLTRKTAKDAAAQLSQDEQAHANFLKAVSVPVVMDYKTALDAVNTAKRTATEADAALTVAEESYNAALKSGDPAAVAAATNALQTARAKLKVDTDAVKTSEDNLKKSQDAVTAATKELLQDDKDLDAFYTREMVPHLTDLWSALDSVRDGKEKAQTAAQNLRNKENELQAAILAEGKETQHVKDLTVEASAARQEFNNKTKDLHDIEQVVQTDLGVSGDALHDLKTDTDDATKATENLNAAYSTLGLKSPQYLQDLADKAHDAFQAIHDSGAYAGDAWVDYMQKQQAAAEAVGNFDLAGKIKGQLDGYRAEVQRQEELAKPLWVTLAGDINSALDGVSKKIGELIVDGDFSLKNLGLAFEDAFKKVAVDAISYFVEHGLVYLMDHMKSVLDFIPGLGDAIDSIFKKVPTSIATPPFSTTSGIPGLGGQAGGGTSGAAGASGFGGALGIFNAATGAISAITGVLQLFGIGQGGEKDRLNIIANSTSYLAWVFSAGGGHDALLNIQNTLINSFEAFTTWNRDWEVTVQDILVDLTNHIRSIDATLKNGIAVSGTGTDTTTAPSTTTDQQNKQTDQQKQQQAAQQAQVDVINKTLTQLKEAYVDAFTKYQTDLGTLTTTQDAVLAIKERIATTVDALNNADTPEQQAYYAQLLSDLQGQLVAANQQINETQQRIQADLDATVTLGQQLTDTQTKLTAILDAMNPPTTTTTGNDTSKFPSAPGGSRTDTQQNPPPPGPDMSWYNLFGDVKAAIQDWSTIITGVVTTPDLPVAPNPPTTYNATQNAPMAMKGNVFLDSRELWSSFVQFAEDNGLVIPQS